jgi:starch synthase
LLIPSRYEPCGVTQMIAMRYGCIPVARATGGLKDTIIDFDQSNQFGNGFLFENADAIAFEGCIERALDCFSNNEIWSNLQRRGLNTDFSWERSAREYLTLYRSLVNFPISAE